MGDLAWFVAVALGLAMATPWVLLILHAAEGDREFDRSIARRRRELVEREEARSRG